MHATSRRPKKGAGSIGIQSAAHRRLVCCLRIVVAAQLLKCAGMHAREAESNEVRAFNYCVGHTDSCLQLGRGLGSLGPSHQLARIWLAACQQLSLRCDGERIGLHANAAQHDEVRVFCFSFLCIVPLFSSLDAIDPLLPHTADNVQWVCIYNLIPLFTPPLAGPFLGWGRTSTCRSKNFSKLWKRWTLGARSAWKRAAVMRPFS